ncbi:uncharacterized protein LOC111518562 [Drosophila willistoni]|uniref:uncharacterized protein LOC111518562 n=1 Tax=Drosophila willistoni TaxID=7260 RepID=UPI000C26C824|nr:uncharacterized protein LOC111518562 [Drosophila willistoni]
MEKKNYSNRIPIAKKPESNDNNMMKSAKLKKLEDQVRIGGKGTARRKHKHVQRTSGFDDKRLQSTLQKLALTPISDIQNTTLTLDDGREMVINSPKVQGSVVCNMYTFSGEMFEVLMKVPNNDSITYKDELQRNSKQKKQKQLLEEDDEAEDKIPLLVSTARKLETIQEEDLMSNEEILKLAYTKKVEINCNKEGNCQKNNVQQQQPQQEQLSKDKKKKKPKKPRNRIRSRNKTVADGFDKPNNNGPDTKSLVLLDGAGDGPANYLNQNQSNLDSIDCISLGDSDKTSIFSDSSDREQTIVGDNDSYITLCPNDEGDDEIVSNGEKQIMGKSTSLDAEEVNEAD